MEAKATVPTTIILVSPGKIGLTLTVNKIEGGARVKTIDPTSRFKDKFEVGDRIVTIDGFRITKISDLSLNKDNVREFGVVKVKKNVSPCSATTSGTHTHTTSAAVAATATTTTATNKPTPAAPKRKATKLAAPREKRLKRYRSQPTKKIQERISRALHQRLFLIEASAPSICPDHGGPSIKFSVLGSTGNVYEVTVSKVPHCSCPDAAKGNLCKHMLFVMLKVVGLPPYHNLVYQSAYLENELDEIFATLQTRLERLGRDVVANEQVQKVHADLKKGIKSENGEGGDDDNESKTVPRKDVDGEDCPICFDELGSDLSQLTFCKSTCGTNFHKKCIQMWVRQSKYKRGGPTCPACRQPWENAATRGKKKAVVSSPSRSEGYDNLGRLQGQSTVRDTSTYNYSSYSHGDYIRRRRW